MGENSSTMFDEERLDSQAVGNLPHVLTIKKSRSHLESEEDLVLY